MFVMVVEKGQNIANYYPRLPQILPKHHVLYRTFRWCNPLEWINFKNDVTRP